jgi:hypothetical protein
MAVSTIDPNGLNIGQIGGTRNKVINGAMVFDQRNGGSAVTINSTANTYTLDRWVCSGQLSDGVYTVQQVTDVPAGAGFKNSAKFTVTTADASIGTGQIYLLSQFIEGNDVADAMFGTAGAKTVTVSFWVRSSVTGTFGGSITNNGNDRSYPFTYAISTADTWEYKTVTIAGDTTGTWLTDTGRGINLRFSLGLGSNHVATAGSWTGTSGIYGATGAVDLIGTLNATWYITGVQLEVGDTATPFEHRSYGQELALCQRYCQVIGGDSVYNQMAFGFAFSSTRCDVKYIAPTTFRAIPTLSTSGQWDVTDGTTGSDVSSFTLAGSQSSRYLIEIQATVTGMTANRFVRIESEASTAVTATFDAEL